VIAVFHDFYQFCAKMEFFLKTNVVISFAAQNSRNFNQKLPFFPPIFSGENILKIKTLTTGHILDHILLGCREQFFGT
jgi:hypothetical protein